MSSQPDRPTEAQNRQEPRDARIPESHTTKTYMHDDGEARVQVFDRQNEDAWIECKPQDVTYFGSEY